MQKARGRGAALSFSPFLQIQVAGSAEDRVVAMDMNGCPGSVRAVGLLPLPKHSHPALPVSGTDCADIPQPIMATNFSILVPFCTSRGPDELVKQLCLLLPHHQQAVYTTEIKEVPFAP